MMHESLTLMTGCSVKLGSIKHLLAGLAFVVLSGSEKFLKGFSTGNH